jgi:2-iminobutanoate/2-iminopropanoate deaminase
MGPAVARLAFVAFAAAATGVVSMPQRQYVTGGGPVGEAATPAVVANGFVFTSLLTAAGDDGRIAGADIAAQTRRVLDRLAAVLEAAGSSRAQAVTVNVYLKRASDFEAMNAVYREAFADRPPTRTTVVADLGREPLVAMSAIAVPTGAPRETLHPPGWMKSPRPYSYIVRAGELVFLSGLVSRRGADDQVVSGSATLQVETILENAKVLLQTAGVGFDQVVSARVFLTDEIFFAEMNDVYRRYFPSAPPARATAVTGLMGSDAKAEITLIATTGSREIVGPNTAPTLPLSPGVKAGGFLFLSGVLGNTPANARDLADQTREVMTRIGRTLEAGGLSYADVVDNIVYLPDVWQQDAVHKVYGGYYPSEPPARSTVGARLVVQTGLVEMMMIAAAHPGS